MLNLLLLRHAKTDKLAAGRKDINRPLTGRGKRDATAMGRYMASNDLMPDLVLCSPALRTRNTWDLVASEWKRPPRVVFERGIYDAHGGKDLWKVLCEGAGNAKSLLVVGHNPSMEALALLLAQKGEKKGRSRLETKFPTAALAVIGLDAKNWTAVDEAAGKLVRFVRPEDIGAGPGA
ncbi:MAG TPA: histidine phosphatase family protein [Aestuariivirga sp.]|nr:histidine phosphatase family protein [Aestuariivirga sp.]